ncbi:MAG: histidine kinase N-terminal 7TM domain-containing protein, partial [Bacteroidota bacterium]
MVLAAFWSFILSFESLAPTIPEKIFWSRLEYFANMGLPLMFLRFILTYGLENNSLIRRYFGLLWIVPVCTIVLVFTNSFHSLIWTGYSWSPLGKNVLVYHHGPAFFIAMAYSLILIIVGNLMLLSFVRKRPRYYQSKAWFLLAGSLFPLVTGMVYTIGVVPLQGLDISPMGILVAGIIFFWGIAREQLFDIVPAGHRLMIEKMNDGVIVMDSRQFIMDINPVALSAFHITDNVVGRSLDTLLPGLSRMITGKSGETEFRTEIWMEEPASRWFEVMHNPMKNEKDKFLGSLLILHDITHRKRNELQLKKLADELTEMNAMKDKLYSIIGHDLRSPFNAILGFSELLADSYDDFTESERKQFAININLTSKTAFSLLENLLEWSRIQLGRTPFSPEELNINLFVNETFHLLRFIAQGKNIDLVNKVSPEQTVYADKNMLSAILRNLLSNGIKFTTPGGRVEVTAAPGNGWVEIMIADTGIGMSERMVQSLFRIDNLMSTPGTANEKGTGLGLILCREFVTKHNGTIRVMSETGVGSRFILNLPTH